MLVCDGVYQCQFQIGVFCFVGCVEVDYWFDDVFVIFCGYVVIGICDVEFLVGCKQGDVRFVMYDGVLDQVGYGLDQYFFVGKDGFGCVKDDV